MKIYVLCENTSANKDITAEHGLSLYIETGNHNILFDMGQTDAFLRNANRLNIDLSKVDIAILSHGHYDHGGGIRAFLTVNKTAPIYVNINAFKNFYNADSKYIGIDKDLINEARITLTDDFTLLDDGLSLHTCNDKNSTYKTDNYGLTAENSGTIYADSFDHEQYLLIKAADKSYLISGCSHKGVFNVMEWFCPDVFIGGFHFMKIDTEKDRNQLKNAADRLLQYNATYYTGHCTGKAQYSILKEYMGEKLHYISSGDTVMF